MKHAKTPKGRFEPKVPPGTLKGSQDPEGPFPGQGKTAKGAGKGKSAADEKMKELLWGLGFRV